MNQARLKTHNRIYQYGIGLQFEVVKYHHPSVRPNRVEALACLGTFRKGDIFEDKKLRAFWLQAILKINQLVRSGRISEVESKSIKAALANHLPQPAMVAAARKFDKAISEEVLNDVKAKYQL